MYVFKEEKKINLDSNKTEAITERCSTKLLLFHWCQKFWKLLAKKLKFICFAELMLEPYDLTKNELLCRHFSCDFTYIQGICFFTSRISRAPIMQRASPLWLLCFWEEPTILARIFWYFVIYFISYGLFLKTVFLSVHERSLWVH